MDKQPLSMAEKEQLKKEINAAIDTLILGCENLDMELAFSMFADSPDFLMMGTDGSLCDYQTYLKNNIDYLMACTSFKLTTYRDEIRIINPGIVIYSWAYGAAATLKTGEQDIVDNAGASFVFKKINGAWKVVYYHESSSPPRRIIPVDSD
jgi:hypothetical protein